MTTRQARNASHKWSEIRKAKESGKADSMSRAGVARTIAWMTAATAVAPITEQSSNSQRRTHKSAHAEGRPP